MRSEKIYQENRINLHSVFEEILSLSLRFKKAIKDGNKTYFLQQIMQVSVEQNITGILEREKDTILQTTQQGYRWFKKSKLAWGKEIRQVRILFNSFSKSSSCRWGWICQRTQISDRKNDRQIFNFKGGSASC